MRRILFSDKMNVVSIKTPTKALFTLTEMGKTLADCNCPLLVEYDLSFVNIEIEGAVLPNSEIVKNAYFTTDYLLEKKILIHDTIIMNRAFGTQIILNHCKKTSIGSTEYTKIYYDLLPIKINLMSCQTSLTNGYTIITMDTNGYKKYTITKELNLYCLHYINTGSYMHGFYFFSPNLSDLCAWVCDGKIDGIKREIFDLHRFLEITLCLKEFLPMDVINEYFFYPEL